MFLWLRSPELAVERVGERVRLGGHDVPEAIVRRRYARGVRKFFSLYRALADAWVIYDNSRAGYPAAVASGVGGEHRIFDEALWLLFSEVGE